MSLKTVTGLVRGEVFLICFVLTVGLGAIVAITSYAMRADAKSGAATTTDIRPALRDEKNGVVCYVHYYNGHESMSCVALAADGGAR